MENKLDYKQSWKGTYREIQYEIVNWRMGWNYYLFIPLEQLPENVKAKFNLPLKHFDSGRLFYDYSGKPILSNLDWHGGITMYEKARGDNGKVIGFKLGCDYIHFWDEGHTYNLQFVEYDAKHSIDKLWEYIPDLKYRCQWDGKFYPESETYLDNRSIRYANVNKDKIDAFYNKTVSHGK